jgi:hypothetical protein
MTYQDPLACLVCRKHRERGPLMPGGPVAEDDLVLVSHVAAAAALGGYLGELGDPGN